MTNAANTAATFTYQTVDMARAAYIERFASMADAIAFEEMTLGAVVGELPVEVTQVLNGGAASVAYYDWLIEQHAEWQLGA